MAFLTYDSMIKDITLDAIPAFPKAEMQINPKVIHLEGLRHFLSLFLLILNGFIYRIDCLSLNNQLF